ncbi:NUDIX hydrolase [Fuscibacter oryzae]|uniref:NUDIX hydrolase n=1 Tax=Fuscibacter oryzae TaxID=2803939 RepID=A0A8J7N083_9RHOB|nr:NUDIX hydrolase [Fuscibacter oryzae]MBL4930149.1 NUDIX hydrolase [Fuscibacter oryzae]
MITNAFAGAKVALLCQGRILTYLRDDRPGLPWAGLWDLPGGGREGGESPVDCLLREVREEFGLRLLSQRLIWSRAFPSMNDPAQAGWFFAGHITSHEIAAIRFGNEGQRWQMVALDLWLARADAVGPLQARTAIALSEISLPEMPLD